MINDRRIFQRFHLLIVVECKVLAGPDECFYGIARDISHEGFSFETQTSDVIPKETLKITIRHPHRDLFVSVRGTVVWKRKGSQFANILGIKFQDIDMDARAIMSAIVSTVGDIPFDAFLLTDDSNKEIGPVKTEELRSGIIEEHKEEDYIYDTEYSERMHAEDMLHKQAIDLDREDEKRKELHDESHIGHLYSLLKAVTTEHNNQRTLFTVIAIAGMLSFALFTLNGYSEKSISIPDQSTGTEIHGSPDNKEPLSSDETGDKKVALNKVAFSQRAAADSRSNNNIEYIIQVGAWKNAAYAHDMLERIRESYPDAVIISDKKFNKIRIPNIKTSKESSRILEDIEGRYNLVPLLIVRRE